MTHSLLEGSCKKRRFSLQHPNSRSKKKDWHIVGAILIDCVVVYKQDERKVRFRHISPLIGHQSLIKKTPV